MKYAITSRTVSTSATLKISHKDAVKFSKLISRKKLSDAKKSLNGWRFMGAAAKGHAAQAVPGGDI